MSPKPISLYSTVAQWAKVKLMLFLQCSLCLQSQIIDSRNYFSRANIPSGEPVFIEISRYFNSSGGKCDVVIRLNKILSGQSKDTHPNGLFGSGFVVSKVDSCISMSKTLIFVVHVDYCLVWLDQWYGQIIV